MFMRQYVRRTTETASVHHRGHVETSNVCACTQLGRGEMSLIPLIRPTLNDRLELLMKQLLFCVLRSIHCQKEGCDSCHGIVALMMIAAICIHYYIIIALTNKFLSESFLLFYTFLINN